MSRLLLVALLALAACAPSGPSFRSVDGKLSYALPQGWTTRDFPGLKYPVASGTSDSSYAPNINLVSEPFDGPLEMYVEGNKETIARMFPDFQLVTEGPFPTDSGLHGFKVVGKGSQAGVPLEQAWYFFQGTPDFYVLTASSAERDYAALEPSFDRSMKSFSLH